MIPAMMTEHRMIMVDLSFIKTPQSFLYSTMSPGWQSNALQIASKGESQIALALPFFNIEILAIVIPTPYESSVTLIFLFTSITFILIITHYSPYIVKSFSDLTSFGSYFFSEILVKISPIFNTIRLQNNAS